MLCPVQRIVCAIVSKSDILGPIDYSSDSENLVSFKMAMIDGYDYGFKYRINIFLLCMSISLL